jgi:hypothetical protein
MDAVGTSARFDETGILIFPDYSHLLIADSSTDTSNNSIRKLELFALVVFRRWQWCSILVAIATNASSITLLNIQVLDIFG